MGYGRGISNGAVGVSLAIKGFYADVMGWPSSHENDMGVDKWSDKMTTVVHIGYQIPIVKNLRFIPVIGYAKIAYGTTDGSDYTISESGIVHNKFSEKKSVSGLDFGGIAVINIKKVNINLAFTKYSISSFVNSFLSLLFEIISNIFITFLLFNKVFCKASSMYFT